MTQITSSSARPVLIHSLLCLATCLSSVPTCVWTLCFSRTLYPTWGRNTGRLNLLAASTGRVVRDILSPHEPCTQSVSCYFAVKIVKHNVKYCLTSLEIQYENEYCFIRFNLYFIFEVLTEVNTKITGFWNVTSCSLVYVCVQMFQWNLLPPSSLKISTKLHDVTPPEDCDRNLYLDKRCIRNNILY